ncbi:hypothetical protein BIW11_10718 [Tropilaelaps mercedesae]|uniref:Uncharacterized protein n=1 Tax=Tropilaelaps mercedesae TaxID=418985 RepID=A0A1V9XEC1_9ACAR|nr:hypothetical protein BIW11_10718 [Tropilaelaps mercedesae]
MSPVALVRWGGSARSYVLPGRCLVEAPRLRIHRSNNKPCSVLPSSGLGPSPVYASDSELGVQSASYYSDREREPMDHYGNQISQRDRLERGRHRESSLERWEQPHAHQHRTDAYRRDSRDMRDPPHGHPPHGQRESSLSSLHREPLHEHRELRERGSLQHRPAYQPERGEGREREGSLTHESAAVSRRSSTYQRGLESGRDRASRDHGDSRERDTGRHEQAYEHRGSFDRTSEREHAQQATHYSQHSQQQQQQQPRTSASGIDQYAQHQSQHRQSLSHSHAQSYGNTPHRERERETEQEHRSVEQLGSRLRNDGRERGQSAYYSDRGLESDGSETSSVISKLSSTTQSEALHRGASDRRQSSGTRGGQQTSRTLSEFTLQKSQGGPVHPLSSSGRGSSNESSSMSMTTREGREGHSGHGGRELGRGGDRRDALGRRAESVEESTRTSSQSVSEAKEGSEEGSLSDTTTANEDKLGGSSFEIADASPYSSSPYANAKANQSHAAVTPQQKSKGARLGFRNRRKNKVGRGVHRSEEVSFVALRSLQWLLLHAGSLSAGTDVDSFSVVPP